jgi:hypothetical protein
MTQLSGQVLAQCLDAIDRGDATLQECLARYPQHREELMPILRMAAMLHDDPSAGPRPLFRRTARQRLLAKLPPRTPARLGVGRWPFWQTFPRRAIAWAAIAVALVVILSSSGIVYAGARTLPGDTLYPVKTTVEEARLWVARGEDDVHLSLRFAEDRIQEIRRLGTVGRFHDVSTAASRFGAQMRWADQALLELTDQDPELAAALALRAEETRTQYQHELTGLLRAVPDSERLAIEGILDLDADLRPNNLFDDEDEQEAPPPTGTDNRPPRAVEPVDVDEKDSDARDDEDSRDDPAGTEEAPERPEPEHDTETTAEQKDGEDEREVLHEPEPSVPGQDDSDPDAHSGATPEPGDRSDGNDGTADDSGEHDRSGTEDNSDEHDGSDSGHEDHLDEHDGSDSGQDNRSDSEHDGEATRDD